MVIRCFKGVPAYTHFLSGADAILKNTSHSATLVWLESMFKLEFSG